MWSRRCTPNTLRSTGYSSAHRIDCRLDPIGERPVGDRNERPILREPHPQLSLHLPEPALGARRRRPAYPEDRRAPPPGRVHLPHPQAEEARGQGRAGAAGLRRGEGPLDPGAAVRAPRRDHQRRAPRGRRLAPAAGPGPMAGDPGDRAPAPALAAPPVQRSAALLLPDRGGRDRHLADRGRPQPGGTSRPAVPSVPGRHQSGGESGAAPPRAQARHRRRQDHGDGHADRVADHQRGAPPAEPPVHPRVPDRDPRPHHQGPAAGAEAERPGQLLPEPGAGPGRPAARPGPREDRHHQLPRPPAPGARRDREGREVPPPGPGGSGARHPGIRGPDAETGDARADGHEERPGAERRGPPLLPGEAGRAAGRRAQGGREEGRREEPGGGAALDLGHRGGESQARHLAGDRPLRHALLPQRLRLRGGHPVPLDDVRLLPHGRHRVRHRQAAAGAGRG